MHCLIIRDLRSEREKIFILIFKSSTLLTETQLIKSFRTSAAGNVRELGEDALLFC